MTHSHDGKFYVVEKGFNFPEKNNEENAWGTWLHDLPGCTVKIVIECMNFRTKPFQLIAPNRLPKNYATRL